uniref:Uncharacterized protein n=1 Tax=Arundo donax TaxID=35708 RepID=A0A0A9HDD4_ARUDO
MASPCMSKAGYPRLGQRILSMVLYIIVCTIDSFCFIVITLSFDLHISEIRFSEFYQPPMHTSSSQLWHVYESLYIVLHKLWFFFHASFASFFNYIHFTLVWSNWTYNCQFHSLDRKLLL